MHIIAHRGNTSGPSPDTENNPITITKVLETTGFDIELDVWFVNNCFWLGHDEPVFKVQGQFLLNSKFWLHAKNIEALAEIAKFSNLELHSENLPKWFFHQQDDVTLTSNGVLWTYPGKKLISGWSIAVMPELQLRELYSSINHHKKDELIQQFRDCYGICTDYPSYYQEKIINI